MMAEAMAPADLQPQCRACLLKATEAAPNVFNSWRGGSSTIAEDLAKLTGVTISATDSYTKIMCYTCCYKLYNAQVFIDLVRESDNVLKGIKLWPQPIQLNRTMDESLFENANIVKEEVLSDDDTHFDSNEVSEFRSDLGMDIKIEPEEIVQPSPVKNIANEVISFKDEYNQDSNSNGCQVYENEEYLDLPLKAEPASEDEQAPSDLSLDCMLCAKQFHSVSGLKAHVITQHSYKSVKRKTNDQPSSNKKKAISCSSCGTKFSTSTDLMVHELSHSKSACYACGSKFDSYSLLMKHRKKCKAAKAAEKSVPHKPKYLDDVMGLKSAVKRAPPDGRSHRSSFTTVRSASETFAGCKAAKAAENSVPDKPKYLDDVMGVYRLHSPIPIKSENVRNKSTPTNKSKNKRNESTNIIFKCSQCDSKFSAIQNLKKHRELVHRIFNTEHNDMSESNIKHEIEIELEITNVTTLKDIEDIKSEISGQDVQESSLNEFNESSTADYSDDLERHLSEHLREHLIGESMNDDDDKKSIRHEIWSDTVGTSSLNDSSVNQHDSVNEIKTEHEDNAKTIDNKPTDIIVNHPQNVDKLQTEHHSDQTITTEYENQSNHNSKDAEMTVIDIQFDTSDDKTATAKYVKQILLDEDKSNMKLDKTHNVYGTKLTEGDKQNIEQSQQNIVNRDKTADSEEQNIEQSEQYIANIDKTTDSEEQNIELSDQKIVNIDKTTDSEEQNIEQSEQYIVNMDKTTDSEEQSIEQSDKNIVNLDKTTDSEEIEQSIQHIVNVDKATDSEEQNIGQSKQNIDNMDMQTDIQSVIGTVGEVQTEKSQTDVSQIQVRQTEVSQTKVDTDKSEAIVCELETAVTLTEIFDTNLIHAKSADGLQTENQSKCDMDSVETTNEDNLV